MNRITVTRWAGLLALLGLIVLIPVWVIWLSPSVNWQPGFLIGIGLLPLLLVLPGVLRGRPYSYAWAAFLAMLYFSHGVVEAWADADARVPALIETTLSVVLFLSAMMYGRWRGRQLKQAARSGDYPSDPPARSTD